MPSNRFYIDTDLKETTLTLTGEELHHLVRVMRLKENEMIEVVNGRGVLSTATIQNIRKDEATLKVTSLHSAEKSREIILAQAIPRMNHLEWIIEKGTELGATAFWLFPGDYSEKQNLSSNQEQRLKAISIAAMKQCGSLFLPSILTKPPLEVWIPIPGSLIYGDTRENAPKMPTILNNPIVIFIGPEKGFSQKEIECLEHKLKAQGVKLHNNILRTETAGITALAQLFI